MAQDNEGSSSSIVPKLVILLVAIACAGFIIALYHCIRVGWCTQYQQRPPLQPRNRPFPFRREEQQSSVENSIAELIPVRKFSKTNLDLEGGDNHTCSICLCEFEEGEELRTLPECVHSFHVSCIDMWFYSHTSCPLCRTDATPSPRGLIHYLELNSERPAPRQGLESSEV
ncbi:hypothetical protein DCAR_0831857 [Daucus carota subsp. sativus]|uniref:RING-type domain-containing protein n=1 Tax=Daucus carota subsp. sativus TaxID=79200 RepID=A0A175YMW1_DAUCS|nr:PREDICTED: RING-H2 finger protein ATL52-like [Daucus carota subsp. sativus]WOH12355.1 hypothetical protein DCAR_0831857 [Daucus carota subsp. sativus]